VTRLLRSEAAAPGRSSAGTTGTTGTAAVAARAAEAVTARAADDVSTTIAAGFAVIAVAGAVSGVPHGELGRLTHILLALGTRKRRANERPVHRTFFDGRRLFALFED
jgi:hypothetical protein